MDDEPPERFDLVCPSCEAEFSRIVGENRPDSFDCPECGNAVDVPEEHEGGEEASDSSSEVDMAGATGETRPGRSGDGKSPIEEEETAQDQETLREVREKSKEIRTVDSDEPSDDVDDDSGVASGRNGSGPANLDPGGGTPGRDFSGGSAEQPETVDGDQPLPEKTEGGAEDDDIEKTPHVGMDKIAEKMAESGGEGAGSDSDPLEERFGKSGEEDGGSEDSETGTETSDALGEEESIEGKTPSTAIESALDGDVAPGIGEETEAAIDKALDEEFSDDEREEEGNSGSGTPSSAEELVTSLREESSLAGDVDSAQKRSGPESGDDSESAEGERGQTGAVATTEESERSQPMPARGESPGGYESGESDGAVSEPDVEETSASPESQSEQDPAETKPPSGEASSMSFGVSDGGDDDEEIDLGATKPPTGEGEVPSVSVESQDENSEVQPSERDADSGLEAEESELEAEESELEAEESELETKESEPATGTADSEEPPPVDLEDEVPADGTSDASDQAFESESDSEKPGPTGGEAESTFGEPSGVEAGTADPMQTPESSESPPEQSVDADATPSPDEEPLEEEVSSEESRDSEVAPAQVRGSDVRPGKPEESGRSTLLLATAAILAAFAGGLGLVVYFNPGGILPTDSDSNGSETASGASTDERPDAKPVVDRAKRLVREARQVDVRDHQLQREVAERLAERGDHLGAARIYGVLWEENRQVAETAKAYVNTLAEAQQYSRARRVAMQASGSTGNRETFEKAFDETVDEDPRLHGYDPVDVAELGGVQSLAPAEELDAEGFAVAGTKGVNYVFAPAKTPVGHWRDDIAAWRLCELLVCRFRIPETRAARISRADFLEMFEGGDSAAERYMSEFEWSTPGETGEEDEEVVYGSLKKWPEDAVRWPVELTEVWRPWLNAAHDPSVLETPLEEALADFKELRDGQVYSELVEVAGETTTRELAAQLSDIFVFDFLTNNWDRFADERRNYGSRNHFANGALVTLRTSSVFQRRKSTRVEGRFGWVSRFGQGTLLALHALEKDRTNSILYPDATVYDRKKLEIFWEQRSSVLDRVEELIREEGRESVVMFE